MTLRRVAVAVLAAMGLAYGAKAEESATRAAGQTQPATATRPAETMNKPTLMIAAGKLDMQTQDLDIKTALHFLSLQTKCNIVASEDVKGTVTVMLHQVTFYEALRAILTPKGYAFIEEGNILYVYTKEELEKMGKKGL